MFAAGNEKCSFRKKLFASLSATAIARLSANASALSLPPSSAQLSVCREAVIATDLQMLLTRAMRRPAQAAHSVCSVRPCPKCLKEAAYEPSYACRFPGGTLPARGARLRTRLLSGVTDVTRVGVPPSGGVFCTTSSFPVVMNSAVLRCVVPNAPRVSTSARSRLLRPCRTCDAALIC